MKESFGEKLKRARAQSGLKQSELAKSLGVKNTTISNWENNISKPDLDMLSYICGALNVKASFFLEAHPPIEDIDYSEFEIIEKYRDLDPHGKEMVDFTLLKEWERSTFENKTKNKILPITIEEDTEYVKAAHAIENATEEDKQFDENIMKNF